MGPAEGGGPRTPSGATGNHCPFFPQLAGGVILGVALWLRHDPQTTNILYLELGDKPAPNTFYVGECERGWEPARWPIEVSEHELSEVQAGSQGGLPGGGRA